MKRLFLLLLVGLSHVACAQVNIYDPAQNAEESLNKAILQAQKENKNVLVQVGGNWCPWCVKLHGYFNTNEEVKTIINDNYVVIKVNYSPENKNTTTLKRLENPQRFGFPVLVILDSNGKRIHTQDSGLLESGDGYDDKKVLGFLKNWTKDAIENPKR